MYLPMISKVQSAVLNLAKIGEALFEFPLGHCAPNSTNVNNPPFLLKKKKKKKKS